MCCLREQESAQPSPFQPLRRFTIRWVSALRTAHPHSSFWATRVIPPQELLSAISRGIAIFLKLDPLQSIVHFVKSVFDSLSFLLFFIFFLFIVPLPYATLRHAMSSRTFPSPLLKPSHKKFQKTKNKQTEWFKQSSMLPFREIFLSQRENIWWNYRKLQSLGEVLRVIRIGWF